MGGMRALCKWNGCLVIAEVTRGDGESKCPQCGCKTLVVAPYGWMDCEDMCGFSINKSHWDSIQDENISD